jgi:acetyl esterase
MIDPQLQPFLAEWARQWAQLPLPATAAQRRAHFERVASAMREPTPPGVSTDEQHTIDVPGAAGAAKRRVRVRVFRSGDASQARAALIYMHGGAWMQGSPETHWDITARLAADCDMVVFSVDYALAPEHPFPAAVDDCRTVVHWVFERAPALGVDARAVAIGGDSAGANLAAAMTLEFRDTPQRLRAQLLIYPACDFSMDRPSYRENPDGPIVTVASMPSVNAAYCPDPKDLTHPLVAPLHAASHRNLPPAYVAVAEHDPLRDSGLAYAHALRDADVAVHVDAGTSLIHGYLRAKVWCEASRSSLERMGRWLSGVCRTAASD